MNSTTLIIKVALEHWEQMVRRADAVISDRSDEILSRPVAPGKNTGVYIIGHLIAINDTMLETIGIGEAKYPELFEMYFRHPDGAALPYKTMPELREIWKETHGRIAAIIQQVPEDDWLKRHARMTDEEFEQNPLRNKLSVFLNRATHIGYHVGQLTLVKP